MKLVGATKWYIMRPLLSSALVQGLVAGVVATILVCVAVYGVGELTPAGIAMIPYCEVAIILASMLLLGVVITVLFSAVAVNKFVNMKSNKIYLY
jgi:cell division transport system permease protein